MYRVPMNATARGGRGVASAVASGYLRGSMQQTTRRRQHAMKTCNAHRRERVLTLLSLLIVAAATVIPLCSADSCYIC